MRLSEIKRLLAENEIRLTRSLGQNFMHDQNQLRRILLAAELGSQDNVLEIGPGLGPLTELLAAEAGRVLAIEKDAKLLAILRKRLAGCGGLDIIHDDALEYLRREPADWGDWKLVSNLPYSCASPILVELAQANRGPSLMVATVQLEVAERLEAAPGTKQYGLLSVLIQAAYQPEIAFRIPASCFYPEPAVDSACIRLRRRPAAIICPEAMPAYTAIVKRAFSQRRKMLGKLLRQDWSGEKLYAALRKAEISPEQRAEQIGPEQFARLTLALRKP